LILQWWSGRKTYTLIKMARPKKSRYTLIKGKYWIYYPDKPRQGPEPDGDTIRFEPDNIELVLNLPRFSGKRAEFNKRRNIAVRYEGIDALETHFREMHQELAFANAARDENLRLLGFGNIVFSTDSPNQVQSVNNNPLPGYVIASGIEANGRLLGLVYAGASHREDGENIFVEDALLDQSVNAKLVKAGLCYVEPYDTMPMSLIARLRRLVSQARKEPGIGLWPHEDVNIDREVVLTDLAQLETLIIWPKLFRRLVAYFFEGHAGLEQFDEWIRQDPVHRDDSLQLPDGERGNIHDTYVINGDSLRLRFNPEQLIITPDPKPLF
jgi:endonuclease YncB( thermonuclease family)